MQYEYDTNGDLSSLVLMTFLLVLLVPLSYRVIRPKRSKTAATEVFPVKIEDDDNAKQVTHSRPQKSSLNALYTTYFSTKNVFLVGGWLVVAYLGYAVATAKRETKYWNPYDILGIDESATEKEIKKHYKRLSIKFHPDKVRLAVNQTLEQVQEQFVDLTKAYKALTDEEVRQNFLEHGNPDGKQDLSVGIALPSWMVEGGQSLWVLAAYCLTLLVGLPTLVGRWWYRSAKITKDGLLNLTAERYFKGIQDKMSMDELIALFCTAAEYDTLVVDDDDITRLSAEVEFISGVKPIGPNRPVETLLRAHLHRIPLKKPSLSVVQNAILEQFVNLHKGLFSVALSYGYLDTQMKILQLSPAIVQAIPPGGSPLLQLPYATGELLAKAEPELVKTSLQELVDMEDGKRRQILGLSESQYTKAMAVASALPIVEAARVEFQVEGDDRVTSNAIVQLVFKLRRAGGEPLKDADLTEDQPDEDNVEAILRADEALAATAVPDTLSWSPYFPVPLKNHLWLSMADSKQDRVIVGPMQVEDIGDQVRTFKIPFQAPPAAGLYTFQVHIMSDTYVGMDETFHMELNVVEHTTGAKEEDEISEPDEDTLAGQMAAMKGGAVKKSTHEYDSSSEEELTDTSDEDSD